MSDGKRANIWLAALSAAMTIFSVSAAATVRTGDGGGNAGALCRSVDDGTACDAIKHGLTDARTGLSWRRLADDATWADADRACAGLGLGLGLGWRLPSLAELDQAFQTDAFGYCSMVVWAADKSEGGAWVEGAVYEGSPICHTEGDGSTVCIGGCGMMSAQREPEALDKLKGVVCVRVP